MTAGVVDTLRKARALIEDPKHWTQGAYARSARGRKVLPEGKAAVCWCMAGALRAVCGGSGPSRAEWALAEAFGFIDRPYSVGALGSFNDSHSHDEILAAYDKAIAAAESDQ